MRIGSVSLSLLLATAISLVGNGLLSTLVAVRLADAGVADSASGWILAGYFGGLTSGTLLLGPTIGRVGNIRAFSAFTALGVAAALGHGFIPAGWGWVPLRALTGLSMAGVYMTVESWLNAEALPAHRGRVMAAYLVALYLGTGLGQLLLPIWPETGLEAFAFAALAASLAAIPVSLTRVPQPNVLTSERLSAIALLRTAPIGWWAAAISGFVAGTIYSSVPLAARSAGLSSIDVSQLMVSFVLGGLAGQWPIGWLSDRTDRRRVLMLVALLLAICCGAFMEVDASESKLRAGLAFVFGALAFSIYPLAVAHTLDRVGERQSLPAAGQMLLASSVGAVLGPIVAGLASARFGPNAFYAVDGLLLAALALGVLSRLIRFVPVSQDDYVAIPRTSFAINELDPRTDAGAPADSVRRGPDGGALALALEGHGSSASERLDQHHAVRDGGAG